MPETQRYSKHVRYERQGGKCAPVLVARDLRVSDGAIVTTRVTELAFPLSAPNYDSVPEDWHSLPIEPTTRASLMAAGLISEPGANEPCLGLDSEALRVHAVDMARGNGRVTNPLFASEDEETNDAEC